MNQKHKITAALVTAALLWTASFVCACVHKQDNVMIFLLVIAACAALGITILLNYLESKLPFSKHLGLARAHRLFALIEAETEFYTETGPLLPEYKEKLRALINSGNARLNHKAAVLLEEFNHKRAPAHQKYNRAVKSLEADYDFALARLKSRSLPSIWLTSALVVEILLAAFFMLSRLQF